MARACTTRILVLIAPLLQGAHSTADEQGTAALKAVELDDRLGGKPIQIRVVQGKEPPHFLAMFGGKFTVFQGGISSRFEGEFVGGLLCL